MSLILSGSDGVSDIDGTVSTPAIRGTDSNTGIFFPAADTIAFSEGGAEAMRIDSGGNLCVGSTAGGNAGSINVSVGLAGTTVGGLQLWSTTIATHYVNFGDGTTGSDTYRGYVGYAHASDALLFGTSTAERMRIDSSGNLLVGSTSADLSNNNFISKQSLDTTAGIAVINNNTGSSASAVMRYKNSGSAIAYTGLGGTNRAAYAGLGANILAMYTDNAAGMGFLVDAAGPMTFNTNALERMRIDSSGALLVGTTTVYNTATTNVGFVGNVGSGISINSTTNTNGATYEVFLTTGTLIGSISNNNNTGVLYNVTSDYRLKNNAVALTGAKDFVMALKPKAWDWYNDLGKGVGFIAHEFMEVAKYSGFGEKDAVDSNGKPIYQTIQASSTEVMANIVALIQEQQALIENLTTRLNALEGN